MEAQAARARRQELDALRRKLARVSYDAALGWANGDAERLRIVAAARGYKAGWVWHQLEASRQAA